MALNEVRLALVSSSLHRAGAEKQTAYIARALHETGVKVGVFHFGPPGFYEAELNALGIPFVSLAIQGKPLFTLFRTVAAIRRFRPDFVFGSQFADGLHAGLAGRLSGALALVGVRSNGFAERKRYRKTFWLAQSLAHNLVTNSLAARENLISIGVDKAAIKVLPNVIDLERFDNLTAEPIAPFFNHGSFIVTAVGRLHRVKRFDRVLDAVAQARRSVPNIRCMLVGQDQGARKDLEVQAASLGLTPEHVAFTGECHNVPALLATSHVLVHCSDHEGFPNVLLEAMATRIPVICTPAGDAGVLVKNGHTGYLVDFNAVPEMARRIVEIANSPEIRKSFGENGRLLVETDYSFHHLPRRLRSLLEEACRENHRPGILRSIQMLDIAQVNGMKKAPLSL